MEFGNTCVCCIYLDCRVHFHVYRVFLSKFGGVVYSGVLVGRCLSFCSCQWSKKYEIVRSSLSGSRTPLSRERAPCLTGACTNRYTNRDEWEKAGRYNGWAKSSTERRVSAVGRRLATMTMSSRLNLVVRVARTPRLFSPLPVPPVARQLLNRSRPISSSRCTRAMSTTTHPSLSLVNTAGQIYWTSVMYFY